MRACRPDRCTTTSRTSRRCAPKSRSGSRSGSRRCCNRCRPTCRADERVAEIIERRAGAFEAITPVRRAALLSVHDSPTIKAGLARLDRRLRRQLDDTFPDLDVQTLDALDATLAWDTWNRLRTAQGCSTTRARRVLERMVTALLEGSNR